MNHPVSIHALGAAALAAAFWCSASLAGTPSATTPDLSGAPAERGWKLINRSARLIDRNGAAAIRLEGKGGTGLVRLENLVFADGTIEFDARGRNVVQGSFLGLAFHGGADVKTYDAIYFRPFNFQADDPARRLRAVQYISHPLHPWQKLRTEHPGQYEKPVAPVPDPDGWFHVRIVVAWPKVAVFVDGAKEPCLSVTQLSERRRGWLALWTDVNGGDFANLTLTPAPASR